MQVQDDNSIYEHLIWSWLIIWMCLFIWYFYFCSLKSKWIEVRRYQILKYSTHELNLKCEINENLRETHTYTKDLVLLFRLISITYTDNRLSKGKNMGLLIFTVQPALKYIHSQQYFFLFAGRLVWIRIWIYMAISQSSNVLCAVWEYFLAKCLCGPRFFLTIEIRP